jgi:uncharacterized protein YecT (DUF1311 family)
MRHPDYRHSDPARPVVLALVWLALSSCALENGETTQAVASQRSGSLSEAKDCADVTPNAAYTECFRQLVIAAQAEVDAEIAKARKLVVAADEEYSRYEPDSLTAQDKTQLARHLAVSHENWSSYADAQCELEATAARGGSGTDTLRQKCLLRLARLRLTELCGAEALIDGNR